MGQQGQMVLEGEVCWRAIGCIPSCSLPKPPPSLDLKTWLNVRKGAYAVYRMILPITIMVMMLKPDLGLCSSRVLVFFDEVVKR